MSDHRGVGELEEGAYEDGAGPCALRVGASGQSGRSGKEGGRDGVETHRSS